MPGFRVGLFVFALRVFVSGFFRRFTFGVDRVFVLVIALGFIFEMVQGCHASLFFLLCGFLHVSFCSFL